MANMRLVTSNFADTGNITVDPALVAETPIANLQSASRSKLIRTDAYGEVDHIQDLLIDLLPVQTVSAIILGRHNFTAGTPITITMYDGLGQTGNMLYGPTTLHITADESGGEPITWGDFTWGSITWGQTEASDEFIPDANWIHWITTPVSGIQSIKISIEVPVAEVEIGRLIIGNYIEPTYNLKLGHSLSWTEKTKQYRTDGGTLRSDISLPVRKITFDLGTINEDDRDNLQAAMRYVGLRKDFYISLFPEDETVEKKRDYSGIMKLTKVPSMQEYAPSYYKSKYTMEEV